MATHDEGTQKHVTRVAAARKEERNENHIAEGKEGHTEEIRFGGMKLRSRLQSKKVTQEHSTIKTLAVTNG